MDGARLALLTAEGARFAETPCSVSFAEAGRDHLVPGVLMAKGAGGSLLTAFHNKALMSPATGEVDVDRRHTAVLRGAVLEALWES